MWQGGSRESVRKKDCRLLRGTQKIKVDTKKEVGQYRRMGHGQER